MTTATIDRTRTAAAVRIPRLGDDPEVAAAQEQLDNAKSRAKEIEREIDELLNERNGQSNTSTPRDQLTAAAERWLAGDSDQGRTQEPDGYGARYEDLTRQRRLFEEIVRIASARLLEVRTAVAARLCEELAPAHLERAKALGASMVAVAAALIEGIDFGEGLFSSMDTIWLGHLEPLVMPTLGDPREPNSLIATWLMQALRAGYVDAKAIPEAWRSRWPAIAGD